MEALLVLLGLSIPLGLFIGWLLGIAGWRQARALRAEVAALRAALRAAGIAVPDPVPAETTSGWPPSREAAAPNPWAAPATPEPEAAPLAARTAETAEAPAAPPPQAPPGSAAAPPGPGLEAVLTLRWGTWLGAAALLLAGIFLVRYAVEEGWLGPAARCALAGLLGLALIVAAEWLRRRPAPERPGIPWPDQAPPALAAGGVAVLFGAAYGAAVLYALVPPLAGFALLALAALAGIALALLQGPLVAAVGIAGAFVTPALVETQDPSLPGLFAYLLAVTAAALVVLRQVGAAWLGWAATIGAALWVVAGLLLAAGPGELWAPALFVPAAAALHLALLPGAALEGRVGRRLAWVPFAALAAAGLLLVPASVASLAGPAGVLLLTPVAVWKAVREERLDLLPWMAALAGLLLLLLWPLGAWSPTGEAITIAGVVQSMLPGPEPWPPAPLRPFLLGALLLAALHGAAGLWQERRAPQPLRWAALTAAVPVLVLLVCCTRVRGFAPDVRWALAAMALAAALVGAAAAAMRAGAAERAGAHAAGAVAALALGLAMVLSEHWLTLGVALFLPALAWIEGRTGLAALRRVALAVAAVVLVRLLLNWHVLDYAFGPAPLLNEALPAYGVPALCFALAAVLFRRRGDDLAVAVLEAGAIAFLTALVMLQIRHAFTGGTLSLEEDWSFLEAALQVLGLGLLAAGLRLLNRRLGGRPVLAWGWRAQQAAALLGGVLLLLGNPGFDAEAVLRPAPLLNELLPAYLLPGLLAAAAARAPESGRPEGFRAVLAAYALAAGFAWVSLEVRHGFQPEAMALELAPPKGAELWAYSGAWLVLGAALLALGLRLGQRALRLAALGLLGLTAAKAVLVDMAGLAGLWRVLSFLGLGLALIGLGWVYRRFVVVAPAATAPPAPAPPG